MYAVQRIDVRICDFYQPLQEYLIQINGNKTNYLFHTTSNNSNTLSENNKYVFTGIDNNNYNVSDSDDESNSDSNNRNLLFWKRRKKWKKKGIVGWVKEQAKVVIDIIDDPLLDAIDVVETVAGDVLEVIEETATAALDQLENSVMTWL